jgi:hypothetical protein
LGILDLEITSCAL